MLWGRRTNLVIRMWLCSLPVDLLKFWRLCLETSDRFVFNNGSHHTAVSSQFGFEGWLKTEHLILMHLIWLPYFMFEFIITTRSSTLSRNSCLFSIWPSTERTLYFLALNLRLRVPCQWQICHILLEFGVVFFSLDLSVDLHILRS